MMMSAETRARLESADDPAEIVRPRGFDRAGAIERVRAIVPALERATATPLVLDAIVQDASHCCAVDAFRTTANGRRVAILSILFSSFGGLVTLYGSSDFAPDRFAPLVEILRGAGFAYIAAAELSGEYDGVNPRFRGTWFDRFFSYL